MPGTTARQRFTSTPKHRPSRTRSPGNPPSRSAAGHVAEAPGGASVWARALDVRRHLRELFVPSSGSAKALAPLDGFRACLFLWMLAFHSLFFMRDHFPSGGTDVMSSWPFSFIQSGYGAVDGFFVLTGFLVAYPVFRKAAEAASGDAAQETTLAPPSLRSAWYRRYARVWPPMVLVLVLYCLVAFPEGLAPLDTVHLQGTLDSVQQHFPNATRIPNLCFLAPANLLFLNNLMPIGGCMGWTWSLCVQCHFYFWFPVALKAVGKRVNPSKRVAVVAGVTAIASAAIRAYVFVDLILHQERSPERDFWMFMAYANTVTRIGTICAGVVVAYAVVARSPARWLRAHTAVRALGWLVAASALLVNMFYVQYPDNGFDRPKLERYWYDTLYGAGGPGWTFGFSWLLLMLLSAEKGMRVSAVDRMLSAPVFAPVARVSYLGYLIHPSVMMMLYSSAFYPLTATVTAYAGYATAIVAVVLAASTVLYVLAERPLDVLMRG